MIFNLFVFAMYLTGLFFPPRYISNLLRISYNWNVDIPVNIPEHLHYILF